MWIQSLRRVSKQCLALGQVNPNAISLAELSREMVQAAQEKGIAVPRMDEIEAEYKKRQANQGAAQPTGHSPLANFSISGTHPHTLLLGRNF